MIFFFLVDTSLNASLEQIENSIKLLKSLVNQEKRTERKTEVALAQLKRNYKKVEKRVENLESINTKRGNEIEYFHIKSINHNQEIDHLKQQISSIQGEIEKFTTSLINLTHELNKIKGILSTPPSSSHIENVENQHESIEIIKLEEDSDDEEINRSN